MRDSDRESNPAPIDGGDDEKPITIVVVSPMIMIIIARLIERASALLQLKTTSLCVSVCGKREQATTRFSDDDQSSKRCLVLIMQQQQSSIVDESHSPQSLTRSRVEQVLLLLLLFCYRCDAITLGSARRWIARPAGPLIDCQPIDGWSRPHNYRSLISECNRRRRRSSRRRNLRSRARRLIGRRANDKICGKLGATFPISKFEN